MDVIELVKCSFNISAFLSYREIPDTHFDGLVAWHNSQILFVDNIFRSTLYSKTNLYDDSSFDKVIYNI